MFLISISEHHNLHFTSQLLQMTLTYLHSLLEDGTRFIERHRPGKATIVQPGIPGTPDPIFVKDPAMVSAVEDCLLFVTKRIVELRRYLGNMPEDLEVDGILEVEVDVPFNEVNGKVSWDRYEQWRTMEYRVYTIYLLLYQFCCVHASARHLLFVFLCFLDYVSILQDVIKDAVVSGTVSTAQAFFLSNKNRREVTTFL